MRSKAIRIFAAFAASTLCVAALAAAVPARAGTAGLADQPPPSSPISAPIAAGSPQIATDPGASPWDGIDEGKVRLIAATAAVGRTDEVMLGLEFRMAKGWKIYWRSPGDAGYPPHLDWSGSENLAAADVLWPVPMRFRVLGFETFGYEDHVVLPVRAKLSQSGAPAALRVKVDYLVCQEICVPATGRLTLALTAGEPRSTAFAGLIDQYVALIPGDGGTAGLAIDGARAAGSEQARALRLDVRSATPLVSPDAYVEGPGEFRFGFPATRLSPDRTRAVLTVPVSVSGATELVGESLMVTLVDGGRAAQVQVTVAPASSAPDDTAGWAEASAGSGAPGPQLWFVLLLAVAGGLILNLMPCVLPVLSIKLLKVVGQAGRELADVRKSFLASSAGILFSFLVLAAIAVLLKAAGMSVGWGMQFQYPAFLAAMVAILTLFAANLWGLFEITLPRALADRFGTERPGHTLGGSFLTGAFVTVLATPCTAPFLGTAVGFALSRGPTEIFAVFAALGLGLALPYVGIAVVPGIVRFMPRPGAWMVTLRRVLGFALAATALWLLSVLRTQVGQGAALAMLALMVAMTGLLWVASRRPAVAKAAGIAAALLAIGSVFVPGRFEYEGQGTAPVADGYWQPFDRAAIAGLVASGKVVLVDVTADWCLTCKVNEALVLKSRRVSDELSRARVVAMRADWTHQDDAVAAYLASFGRFGIPFNAVYGPDAPEGIALPELLTERAVLDALWRAGAHALAGPASGAKRAGPDRGPARPKG
ncbi:MAG: protein-disulfide reductase DsbD domain-containing protein [Alphaproteobacteria bacterium]